jgi:tetratricopeptide (TPR) repeat protein
MGDSSKGQLVRREKGNLLSNAKREEKENNVNKFLDKFNTSGRADLLKEKLKKFIVRIVREKYNKKDTSVKGVFKDKRDQFYSELYAYLTDSVKKATDEFVKLKKDELHEHILVTFNQSKKEIMNYAIRENKEPEDKRLLRLSKEYELLGDYNKSIKYFKSLLLVNQNKENWLSYLRLSKKIEDLPEVENALKTAASIDINSIDLNTQIIFCGLLYFSLTILTINFFNFSFNKSALPLVLNLSKNLLILFSFSSLLALDNILPFSLLTNCPFAVSPIDSSYVFAIAAIAILNCFNKSPSISSIVTAFFSFGGFLIKSIGSGKG